VTDLDALMRYKARSIVEFADDLTTEDRRVYLDLVRRAYLDLEDAERRIQQDAVLAKYGATPGGPVTP
jgi:hypothetical protein